IIIVGVDPLAHFFKLHIALLRNQVLLIQKLLDFFAAFAFIVADINHAFFVGFRQSFDEVYFGIDLLKRTIDFWHRGLNVRKTSGILSALFFEHGDASFGLFGLLAK